MGKLLRIDGRPLARVIAYDSPKTRSPLGVVVPKGTTRALPRTATTAMVRFYDSKTRKFAGKGPSMIKASTARKLELE